MPRKASGARGTQKKWTKNRLWRSILVDYVLQYVKMEDTQTECEWNTNGKQIVWAFRWYVPHSGCISSLLASGLTKLHPTTRSLLVSLFAGPNNHSPEGHKAYCTSRAVACPVPIHYLLLHAIFIIITIEQQGAQAVVVVQLFFQAFKVLRIRQYTTSGRWNNHFFYSDLRPRILQDLCLQKSISLFEWDHLAPFHLSASFLMICLSRYVWTVL
jgi:hypothetical protein